MKPEGAPRLRDKATEVAPSRPAGSHRLFFQRLLIVFAAVMVLILIWRLHILFVLLFGGIVVAVLLRVAAEPFQKRLGLGSVEAISSGKGRR